MFTFISDKKIDVGEGGPRRAEAVFRTLKRAEPGAFASGRPLPPGQTHIPPAFAHLPVIANIPVFAVGVSPTAFLAFLILDSIF